MKDVSANGGTFIFWIVAFVSFLIIVWIFNFFASIGNLIEEKAELAKEQSRQLKLEKDEREVKLKYKIKKLEEEE